jgi:putative protease
VWKTSDPELDRRLRTTFEGDRPKFQRPIQMEVHGRAGRPLTLVVRDEIGHVVQVASLMPLSQAAKQPLATGRLREQLGRLGGTPFKLGELKILLDGDVMLPVSELNRLRREVVRQLETLRAQPKRWTPRQDGEVVASFSSRSFVQTGGCGYSSAAAELIVLVRSLPQLEAASRCGVETIYCEFEDPKKYCEAVNRFRAFQRGQGGAGCPPPAAADAKDGAPGTTRPTIWVAPPRIFKTGEEWILKLVRACDADGYLVRNYDHLRFFAGCRCRGDFSLNVANPLTAEYFVQRHGLERVTASYDLNITQLEALLQSAPPEWFEITIHQHIPMFHMEHCVFCAFLSNGKDYRDCGRPCDDHNVELRDRVGALHPLKADAGCRNTVYNALAQTGAEFVSRMRALDARRFRIEFLNETAEQVTQTIGKYRQLLSGEITGTQLWRGLKLFNQLGVTRGQIAG